nr:PREDICTED: protein FAR1-RELATED SEQUENCE 5-like [Daucus carota subsp. sativus]
MTVSHDTSRIPVQPHLESSDSEHSNSDSGEDIFAEEITNFEDEDLEDIDIADKTTSREAFLKATTACLNSCEATCFVSPNGSKFWTPNCDKVFKPHTNQHFPTLEDAFSFYREYGRHCGFDVRKSTERTNSRGKLLAKYFQCSRGGNPDANKAKTVDSSQNRRTTSSRCFCPAQIIMKPAGQRGIVVMSIVEEHNHALIEGQERMFLRCNRKLSLAHQNFIMDCARANIGPTKAYTLAKEMVGSYENIGATKNDFKNFSRDVKLRIGEHDADLILGKFKVHREKSKGAFYYSYKVDREGHLTGLFWTDVIAQANYEVFGDIVSFDPTFRTNRYNMVFVPFTGVNNHWKNVTFAAGLIAKENYKNFKWLILSFKEAMGRVPYCVITDQCPAIKKALRLHWDVAKHRLCMWHIMNKLPAKIGPALSSDKKFMNKLKATVYSEHSTPAQFEESWKDVIAEYKLEGNKWLAKMFRDRRQWIPAYFGDVEMAGLLRTTSRSESSNSFFQHFHESGDTLVEFYSSFESAMDKQRLSTTDDDKKSRETPRMETTMPIEKDAADVYTLSIYYLVRDEITSACFHTSMPEMHIENDTRHFTCVDDMLKGKVFKVSIRLSDNTVDCSCKCFFRKGYLCRHSFAALKQCGVHSIPRQYVKARWTKDAVRNHSSLGRPSTDVNSGTGQNIKLKRTRACFEFQTFMDYAWDDEEKIDKLMAALQDINSSIFSKDCSHENIGDAHRADKFVGPIPLEEPSTLNPLSSRNKGCGSRLKSSMEISMKTKKMRTCGICHKIDGHNARTCPVAKK